MGLSAELLSEMCSIEGFLNIYATKRANFSSIVKFLTLAFL